MITKSLYLNVVLGLVCSTPLYSFEKVKETTHDTAEKIKETSAEASSEFDQFMCEHPKKIAATALALVSLAAFLQFGSEERKRQASELFACAFPGFSILGSSDDWLKNEPWKLQFPSSKYAAIVDIALGAAGIYCIGSYVYNWLNPEKVIVVHKVK